MRGAIRILACALAAALVANPAGAELIDRVLATVGGRVITLSDVRAAMTLGLIDVSGSADPTSAAVQRLIDRTLILEEVQRYAPPEPSTADIDAKVAEVEAHFAKPADLEAAIDAAGIDRGAVREWVRNDLRIDRYIAQRFAGVMEPPPEEIDAYVAQHSAEIDPQGKGPEDPAVLRTARDRVIAIRREALVREWLEGLRRRVEITVNPPVP